MSKPPDCDPEVTHYVATWGNPDGVLYSRVLTAAEQEAVCAAIASRDQPALEGVVVGIITAQTVMPEAVKT